MEAEISKQKQEKRTAKSEKRHCGGKLGHSFTSK
jgi:hypothetical protein